MSKKVNLAFVGEMLNKAIELDVSDIHITDGHRPYMRVHGKLTEITQLPVWEEQHVVAFLMRLEIYDQFKKSKSLNSSFTINNRRFRIHVYKTFSGTTIAIRAIPLQIPRFDTLNLPLDFKRLAKKKSGLILVTGATGSGKSTTLASLIEEINNDPDESNIVITVENPVEFLYKGKNARIIQREVGRDVDSFGDAVVDAMREDPDIILIGELQDRETIRNAITLAETGHLVLGSLHSNGAADTFNRIVDAFPGDQQDQVKSQLVNRLLGVIHQTLVTRKDGKGRVPLVEMLMLDDEELKVLASNDTSVKALKTLMNDKHAKGLRTKVRNAAELVKANLIDMETAIRFSGAEKNEINRIINELSRH